MAKKRTEEEKRLEAKRLVETVYPSREDISTYQKGKRKVTKKFSKKASDYVAEIQPPPGRKPHQPLVYEWWEDEAKDQLDDMSETEIHERMKQKLGIQLDDADEEENYILKQLYSHKSRKERRERLHALWDEYVRRKHEQRRKQELLRQIEDIQDPTICGFYFTNGIYPHDEPFSLKHEYYEEHMKLQQEFAKIFKRTDEETFTNKFRRNFWPPKVQFFGKWRQCFRTRGSYLDFPENMFGKEGKPKERPDFDDFSAIDINYDIGGIQVNDDDLEQINDSDEDDKHDKRVNWFVEATRGKFDEQRKAALGKSSTKCRPDQMACAKPVGPKFPYIPKPLKRPPHFFPIIKKRSKHKSKSEPRMENVSENAMGDNKVPVALSQPVVQPKPIPVISQENAPQNFIVPEVAVIEFDSRNPETRHKHHRHHHHRHREDDSSKVNEENLTPDENKSADNNPDSENQVRRHHHRHRHHHRQGRDELEQTAEPVDQNQGVPNEAEVESTEIPEHRRHHRHKDPMYKRKHRHHHKHHGGEDEDQQD